MNAKEKEIIITKCGTPLQRGSRIIFVARQHVWWLRASEQEKERAGRSDMKERESQAARSGWKQRAR